MRTRLWQRQASSTPGASVIILIIVLVSAGILTAWPRLLERTFIDEVEYRMETAPLVHQAITGQVLTWSFPPDEFQAAFEGLANRAGPHLHQTMHEPRYSTTGRGEFQYEAPGGATPAYYLTALQLRIDPLIDDYITITEGTFPEVSPAEAEIREGLEVTTEEPTEIMLAVEAAEQSGLRVGDEFMIFGEASLFVRLSGVFEATDPEDRQWQHQLNADRPLVLTNPNLGNSLHSIAYANPESWGWHGRAAGNNLDVQLWIPVTAHAPDAQALLDDLRAFTAPSYPLPQLPFSDGIRLESPLVDVLERAIARWEGTATVLNMLAAGPIGVMVTVLALATRLAVARRRDTLALATARGGSGRQVRGSLFLEGLVLGVPAAALGAGLATLLVPGAWALAQYIGAAAVGLAPAAFLATAPLPNLRTVRADLRARSASPVRWVVEVLVLGLAATAVFVVNERGLITEGGPDPLSIVAPLLLAVAAAIVAVRVFPLPVLAAHRWLKSRRGVSGFLGSARALREGNAPWVPIMALLVGISIAVFSTVMVTTLRTGVEDATRVQAGGDIRLTGPVLFADELDEIRAIPGVRTIAAVTSIPNTGLGNDDRRENLTLFATDTDALTQVQAGLPTAVQFPPGMDVLDEHGRARLVVSERFPLRDGDLRLSMRPALPVDVVATASDAQGLTTLANWAIVDIDILREHTGRLMLPRLLLIELEDDADTAAVLEALEPYGGSVTSPLENLEQFLASPSTASLERGFVVALAITLALTVLAVILTLVLAAPARGRLMAILRTLGADSSVSRRMVTWETVPLVAISVVFGTALGLLLPVFLSRVVDLRAFTGGVDQPALIYPVWAIVGVVAAMTVVLIVAVMVAASVARRISFAVLRIGDAT